MKAIFYILFLDLCFGSLIRDASNLTLNDGEKIVGGQQIPLSATPYQISLQYQGSHECGGSIISKTVILTAAHCTYRTRPQDLSIRAGSNQVGVGGDVIQVKTIKMHPLYNPFNFNYDFALLILAKPITLKAQVKAIVKLPAQNEPIADGTAAFVSGWGDTLDANESSNLLRGVTVPIVNQNVCRTAYSNLSPQMVCAGDMTNGDIDSCQVSFFESFT